VVAEAARAEPAEEVPHLVGRDRIPRPHVHPSPLLERRAAIDADQPARGVEQAAAGVARIDRGIDLDAVGVFQDRARGKLITVHARDDACTDRWLQVGAEQEGVADGKAFVAHLHPIAVGQFGDGKIVAAEQPHDGQIAGGIDAHEHRVIEPSVGEPAGDGRPSRQHDVKVGGGITVPGEKHARAAAGLAGEDRDRSRRGPADRVDPGLLGLEDDGVDLDATRDRGGGHHDRRHQASKATMPSNARCSNSQTGHT